MTFLWTWSGIVFGYRDGDNLWTYDGRHVGRFLGDTVYAHDGSYLGEVRMGSRLVAIRSRASTSTAAFDRLPNRSPVERGCDSVAFPWEPGYQDFPLPERLALRTSSTTSHAES